MDYLGRIVFDDMEMRLECCTCPQTGVPIAGCGCACHDTRQEYSDDEYDPSTDGYFLVELDTGWQHGVKKLWVKEVARHGHYAIIEAESGRPFSYFYEYEAAGGRTTMYGDLAFSSRAIIPVNLWEFAKAQGGER